MICSLGTMSGMSNYFAMHPLHREVAHNILRAQGEEQLAATN